MCSTSTLAEINQQSLDKQRISLSERFIDPYELLTRYQTFHSNAEALLHDSRNVNESNLLAYEIHHTRNKEFTEVLQILNGDLDNG